MDDGQKAIVCEIVDERMAGVPDMIHDVLNQEFGNFMKKILLGVAGILVAIAGAWATTQSDIKYTQQALVTEVQDRKNADADMAKTINDRLGRIEDGIEKITDWFISRK